MSYSQNYITSSKFKLRNFEIICVRNSMSIDLIKNMFKTIYKQLEFTFFPNVSRYRIYSIKSVWIRRVTSRILPLNYMVTPNFSLAVTIYPRGMDLERGPSAGDRIRVRSSFKF